MKASPSRYGAKEGKSLYAMVAWKTPWGYSLHLSPSANTLGEIETMGLQRE